MEVIESEIESEMGRENRTGEERKSGIVNVSASVSATMSVSVSEMVMDLCSRSHYHVID